MPVIFGIYNIFRGCNHQAREAGQFEHANPCRIFKHLPCRRVGPLWTPSRKITGETTEMEIIMAARKWRKLEMHEFFMLKKTWKSSESQVIWALCRWSCSDVDGGWWMMDDSNLDIHGQRKPRHFVGFALGWHAYAREAERAPGVKVIPSVRQSVVYLKYIHMGVSENSGTSKWMVYRGKPY